MFVFDLKNKINPVIWYKYKKVDTVECTMKARTIRVTAELVEKCGFEIIKKRGYFISDCAICTFCACFCEERGIK